MNHYLSIKNIKFIHGKTFNPRNQSTMYRALYKHLQYNYYVKK